MSLVINTNIASIDTQRYLTSTQNKLNTALQRLSSGMRINSAKDDSAGLAISQRMTAQINGSNVAVRNANDGTSLAQTAEGSLQEITNNLQRIRELAVQSANASNTASDRSALQTEASQLLDEIDRSASSASFNGVKLLDGSFNSQQFQVGANAGEVITVDSIASARTSSLGTYNGFNSQSLGTITNGAASALSVTLAGPGTVYNLGSTATDAKSIAAALNSAGIAGLSAVAKANNTTGSLATTATATAAGTTTFTLNNVNISVSTSTNLTTNVSNTVDAINQQSAATGVSATDTGNGIKLTSADGRNITIGSFTGGAGATQADLGLGGVTTATGQVDVSYKAPSGSAVTSVSFSGAGVTSTQNVASTGTALSNVDVSTVDGANSAITAIDAALDQVNTSRAQLGAIQNRFTSVVASLQTTSENLSAADSRIQDADFAQETANYTKANVLQQAATSMLSQANSNPQQVLTLLQRL